VLTATVTFAPKVIRPWPDCVIVPVLTVPPAPAVFNLTIAALVAVEDINTLPTVPGEV